MTERAADDGLVSLCLHNDRMLAAHATGGLIEASPSPYRAGLVYFAFARELRRVKIGWVGGLVRLRFRIKGMQTGSPELLWVLGVQPGSMGLESRLHDRFWAHRSHGEWFALAQDLEAHILALPKLGEP